MLEEGLASSVTDALHQPLSLAMAIMDLRGFASIYRAIKDGAKDLQSAYVDEVFEFTAELAKERQAQRKKKHG